MKKEFGFSKGELLFLIEHWDENPFSVRFGVGDITYTYYKSRHLLEHKRWWDGEIVSTRIELDIEDIRRKIACDALEGIDRGYYYISGKE